nr:hypothetical protein [Cypionkella psychrotolerans]
MARRRIAEGAATGVDYFSAYALTHWARTLDLGWMPDLRGMVLAVIIRGRGSASRGKIGTFAQDINHD